MIRFGRRCDALRSGWSGAVLVATLAGLGAPAVTADRGKKAKKAYEEANAAFGLGHYGAAAERYEAAFSLRPDPALLYNAAQSYRLAGNKPRALELYRNCLRLYPDFSNADDARNHVATLKKQIRRGAAAGGSYSRPGSDRRSSAGACFCPCPGSGCRDNRRSLIWRNVGGPSGALGRCSGAGHPEPRADRTPGGRPVERAVMVAASASPPTTSEDEPLTRKTWFWVAVGAIAVAGGVAAIVLATRGTSYPDPTLGTAVGN